MQTTHTRKVQASRYGLAGRWATVQVLPASNRGRNARGTTGAKRGWGPGTTPRHASRAPRQGNYRLGVVPNVRISSMGRFV